MRGLVRARNVTGSPFEVDVEGRVDGEAVVLSGGSGGMGWSSATWSRERNVLTYGDLLATLVTLDKPRGESVPVPG
jgi:hypothetical protein